jgi:hypothetical protein
MADPKVTLDEDEEIRILESIARGVDEDGKPLVSQNAAARIAALKRLAEIRENRPIGGAFDDLDVTPRPFGLPVKGQG